MFASLLSLAHSHVVHSLTALINSSRLALALCVCVYLCAYVFARVYVLYILHRGARGLRWSHRATATSHCPPSSQSPVPLWPFAPRLAGSPASGRHTQTQALPPHQPLPEHTHTHTTRFTTPRSGPIDTALRLSSDQSFGGAVLPEENPIQHSLLRVAYSLCV